MQELTFFSWNYRVDFYSNENDYAVRKTKFQRSEVLWCMSKYDALWKYVSESGRNHFRLSYDDIEKIARVPIDHSFLKYKKELSEYGYKVGKISMKGQTVEFIRENVTDGFVRRSSVDCCNEDDGGSR